ncbi:site-specific integrase [Streptomyces hygroscopicus]|uniref:hypothetical protein n=1 Tax=Streptomyces hygroscopicus TaxID=1912 RepID=UPI000A5418F3|nr:hypothetical protein [Streptomyces hygroscopicus]
MAKQHRTTVEAEWVALTMPLPPVHFHDLRDGAATMLIGAGVDDKLMSEALGPTSVSYTKGGYAGVAEELAEDACPQDLGVHPRPEAIRGGWCEHCAIGPWTMIAEKLREPVP